VALRFERHLAHPPEKVWRVSPPGPGAATASLPE